VNFRYPVWILRRADIVLPMRGKIIFFHTKVPQSDQLDDRTQDEIENTTFKINSVPAKKIN